MTLADCADGDLSIDNSCDRYVPLGAAFHFIKYPYDSHRQSRALNVAELHLLIRFLKIGMMFSDEGFVRCKPLVCPELDNPANDVLPGSS